MRSDEARLRDIATAAEHIERYAKLGRERFERDELVQGWFIQHISIIGEACRAMSDPFKATHPEIPWRAIIAMRNTLAHGYFDVDHDLVWETVTNHVPQLGVQVKVILESE